MITAESITKYIDGFKESKQAKMIDLGNKYFDSENVVIMNRKKQFYTEQGLATDPYKANNKLASSFYKIIVKQLVGYLLGNGVNITSKTQEKIAEQVKDTLGKMFPQKLSECAENAVKASVGWLHPYINGEGKFDFDVIPPEQVAFKVSPRNANMLSSVVRHYPVDYNGKKYMKAEVWTEEDVTLYYKEGNKPWTECRVVTDAKELDNPECEMENPRAHITKTTRYGERIENVEGSGWGKIPFIPMWFDSDKGYQLKPIKRHIDGYDIVQSDFMNNLEDIQDAFWILKGYEGEDLNTFLNDVKKFKALKVGENGDAHMETVEIPSEAREKMLASLRKDIFFFGMAVDTDEVGAGNITNVVIKSRYANLDLKADDFENQVKCTIHGLIEFVNKFYELVPAAGKRIDDYELEFDRSLIINEVEIMDMVTKQKGIVSEETFLEHHPWTKDDVKQEMTRLEEDMERNPIIIEEPKKNPDGTEQNPQPKNNDKTPPQPPAQ